MIQIRDREEYDYATKRGFKPLLDYKHFKMDIRLRIEIQTELFGRGVIDTMKANEKFFRWIWANKPHLLRRDIKAVI